MKALLLKYKAVLWFLLVFMGSYLLMSLMYGFYLDYAETHFDGVDPVTQMVAHQTEQLLNEWGQDAQVRVTQGFPGMQLRIKGQIVGLIVEGCNSISIIILFVAFVLAFRQGFTKTILFLLAGGVLVYAVNLIRIAILSMALAKYPEYQDFLHRVIFPGIIYGMVFLLWILWIRSIPKAPSE